MSDSTYDAIPNPWFDSEITYSGIGKAKFSEPAGWIEGEAHCKITDVGTIAIALSINNHQIEDSDNTNYKSFDNILWLLNGHKPRKEGPYQIHLDSNVREKNTCIEIEVNTSKGLLTARGDISYQHNYTSTITLYPTELIFIANESKTPKYWVIPLTNFVHDRLKVIPFPTHRHILDQHPLRNLTISEVPHGLGQEEFLKAIIMANRWNSFIPFQLGESLGFIERLLDYEKRSNDLSNGDAEILITSMMVGDYTSSEEQNIFDVVPLDFLHVLSIASGSLVGTPWIELRDQDGDIVRRFHSRQWQKRYSKGHPTIQLSCKGGISKLLSNSPEKMTADLRTAIQFAVKSTQKCFNLNENMIFMFIAFDTLTQNYRKPFLIDSLDEPQKSHVQAVYNSNVKNRANLYPEQIKADVKDILDKAFREMRMLAEKLENEAINLSEPDKSNIQQISKDIFNRVAQKVKQALDDNNQPNEADAILLLALEHGLHDKDVVNLNIKDWSHRVSMYRNQLIHEGYFKISSGEHKVAEFLPLSNHLQDILIRILLKSLNYDGEYISRIPKGVKLDLDWVQPDTPIKDLGY